MIDDILFKLRWSKDGVWSARLSPEECKVLLAHLETFSAAKSMERLAAPLDGTVVHGHLVTDEEHRCV